MENYKTYRIGNPVEVEGNTVTISGLPRNAEDPFGYIISGFAMGVQEADISPIQITPEILKSFGFLYQDGSWTYEANGHHVRIGDDDGCSVDGDFKDYVPYLHELKNLLYDECDDFVLRTFYGVKKQ